MKNKRGFMLPEYAIYALIIVGLLIVVIAFLVQKSPAFKMILCDMVKLC